MKMEQTKTGKKTAPQVATQRRLTGCELQRHRQPGWRDEEDEEGQRVVRTLFMNLVWAGALAGRPHAIWGSLGSSQLASRKML